MYFFIVQTDGLVQDCSNSSALAMELLQSSNKPSIWYIQCAISIQPCAHLLECFVLSSMIHIFVQWFMHRNKPNISYLLTRSMIMVFWCPGSPMGTADKVVPAMCWFIDCSCVAWWSSPYIGKTGLLYIGRKHAVRSTAKASGMHLSTHWKENLVTITPLFKVI